MSTYNTIIIGGGQAGLAMGYYLKRKKRSHLILEGNARIGDSWRERYDSLKLFTPRSHSALPGLTLKGNQNGYPLKDEIADYLLAYQEKYELPISLNSKVQKITKNDGKFKISTTSNEVFSCENVIIATGPFQAPFTPKMSKLIKSDIYQCHTVDYRNPSQIQNGKTLIVGGGNSGMQIAIELIKESKEVYLSLGKKPRFFPYTILNKSIFWWLGILGILRFTVNSKIGKKIRENDPIIGKEIKPFIKNKRINIFPRAIKAEENKIHFEDGQYIQPENIIWATGFKSDYSYIDITNKSVFDEEGYPIHNRGVTAETGLYFIGLPWQYRRGSGLLLGVGTDAKYLAERIDLKD